MADSSPRGLRWRILWSAAAYAVCVFLGKPSAAFVGLLRSPTHKVLRSATASAAQGKGEGDRVFEEGQEVTLIAPPALAGTKATIVEPAEDGSTAELYRVRLQSGSFFNIPVQNIESLSPKSPKPETKETPESSGKSSKSSSQSSESSSPKDPNLETEKVLESSSKASKSSSQSSESSSAKGPNPETEKVSESSSQSSKSTSQSSESSSAKGAEPETKKTSDSSSQSAKSSSQSSESSSPKGPKLETKTNPQSSSQSSKSSSQSSESSSAKGPEPETKVSSKSSSQSSKSSSQSSESSSPKGLKPETKSNSESSSPKGPNTQTKETSESSSKSSKSSSKSSGSSSPKGAKSGTIKTSSQSSKSSSPKAPNSSSALKSSIAVLKKAWNTFFSIPPPVSPARKKEAPALKKEAPVPPPASPAPVPAPAKAEPANSQQAAQASQKKKREESFAEGQKVTLLYPPSLAGTSGILVLATRSGEYAVQLPSGSIFQVNKDGMKAATDTDSGAGGGSGSVGGSGRGYGGGNGLPPSGKGSKPVPESSNGGVSDWLVKLLILLCVLCATFDRQARRIFQELPRKIRRMLWGLRRKKTYLLRRLDRRSAASAGTDVGALVAILCLALYLMFPKLLAWLKAHLVPLMSDAEAVVLGTKQDGAGSTWMAVWPLAVLALVLAMLSSEIFRLDWRSGEPHDEDRQRPYSRSGRYR